MYNKPEGEVTTREDPEGRPTIFEALPALKGARWIAIGRLDINTTGLLLLTTDGELANAMMHPSFEVEREYVCRVRAPEGEDGVSDKLVDRLQRGVALEDGPAKFDEIERIGGTDSHDWFRVLLKEGRNREVRRLWESQGCQVSRLKRIRYGQVELPQPLLRGQSQELAADRVEALRKELGLEDGAPSALTLQPVIGQRKAGKSTVHVGGQHRSNGYVGGHSTADEGRELRRFDHVREDRGQAGPQGVQAERPAHARPEQPAARRPAARFARVRQPGGIPDLVRARRREHRSQRPPQSRRRTRPAQALRQQARRWRRQAGRTSRRPASGRSGWPARRRPRLPGTQRAWSRRRLWRRTQRSAWSRRRTKPARATPLRPSRQRTELSVRPRQSQ
jgi:23S rRNA pseudouridine2605 synthase